MKIPNALAELDFGDTYKEKGEDGRTGKVIGVAIYDLDLYNSELMVGLKTSPQHDTFWLPYEEIEYVEA